MPLLQHLPVLVEQRIIHLVTALAGGVSTAIKPGGDATAIVILQQMEAVKLPAIVMGYRLPEPAGLTASVAKVHNRKREHISSISSCFHHVATVLQTHPARASHGDGRSEKGDVDYRYHWTLIDYLH